MQIDADTVSAIYAAGTIGGLIAGIIATGRANSGIPLTAVVRSKKGPRQANVINASCRTHGALKAAPADPARPYTTTWVCVPGCNCKVIANS